MNPGSPGHHTHKLTTQALPSLLYCFMKKKFSVFFTFLSVKSFPSHYFLSLISVLVCTLLLRCCPLVSQGEGQAGGRRPAPCALIQPGPARPTPLSLNLLSAPSAAVTHSCSKPFTEVIVIRYEMNDRWQTFTIPPVLLHFQGHTSIHPSFDLFPYILILACCDSFVFLSQRLTLTDLTSLTTSLPPYLHCDLHPSLPYTL